MTYNPIQFPANLIYFDPSLIDTGINRIQVHQIHAQYYSNNIPIHHDHCSWRQSLEENLNQVALIQLCKEAFPHWIPNQYQFSLLQRSHTYISTLPHCEICALPKGIYCESPSIRVASSSSNNSRWLNQDHPGHRKNKRGHKSRSHHSLPHLLTGNN